MNADLYEISLTAFTYGGDALGRLPDGRAVFLPFGLPGERVRVRVVEERRGHVRAELVQVLEASPDRIAARCGHFGVCGGCHYQHMPYEMQLKAKAEILRDQLARIGKIQNAPVGETVASPNPWNYRNHVQFHLTRAGALGYVRADTSSASTVMPITECHLPEPAIDSFRPQLEFEPGPDLERVSLRLGADEALMLVLESSSPEMPELEIAADISAVHLYEGHAAVMAGTDHVTLRVRERDFRVSAGAFFQVNTAVAEKMVDHVLALMPERAQTILDVYCGAGLFSAFLAPRGRRLVGIESSPSACEDFAFNLDEFDHVELYEGDAGDILPALVERVANPSHFLVDPPRAGLERRVLDAIVALGPDSVIYVSCDPSTLARDAARLIAGGYRLVEVTPFDMFPQTYHIESISLFMK
jgi:23S rRNA (uracil1939-C5)-methyltransferase